MKINNVASSGTNLKRSLLSGFFIGGGFHAAWVFAPYFLLKQNAYLIEQYLAAGSFPLFFINSLPVLVVVSIFSFAVIGFLGSHARLDQNSILHTLLGIAAGFYATALFVFWTGAQVFSSPNFF